MDRVRFGRALGYGARHAAKSLRQAAEAAASPSAASSSPSGRQSGSGRQIIHPAAHVTQRITDTRQRVSVSTTHAKTLGRSVWSPLAQFSSVIWLQVTGTFFVLIALFLSEGLWKARTAIHLPLLSQAALKFYLQLAAFAGFTFFAISNFVKAHLRDRRR